MLFDGNQLKCNLRQGSEINDYTSEEVRKKCRNQFNDYTSEGVRKKYRSQFNDYAYQSQIYIIILCHFILYIDIYYYFMSTNDKLY